MRTIFFDVDTQIDFLYPAGALYVPGAEQIVRNVGRLNHFAASNGFPLISDTDAHSENDPEFHDWPAHCVAGTVGQAKPQATLLDQRVVVSSKAGLDVWPAGAHQMLLEKQSLDVFSNPRLPGLLESIGAERFVVYGVVTEICVRCAAWGLIRTGKRVELVMDAIRHLNEPDARAMMAEFETAGGVLVTTGSILV
ncbi:MAG TPA: isochorismatase family protein [Bryobacteraceae bacterium]|nr:isochorismatase family protein [Bryobacteraceae bacterium]